MSDKTATEKHTIDYNAKAKLIFLVTEKEKKDLTEENVKTLLWDGSPFDSDDDTCNMKKFPSQEALEEFLAKHQEEINHGDLITSPSFTHRALYIRIVSYDENTKKFKIILNPDDSGSGYLTIPTEVLKNVTNAIEKYKDIYETDCGRYMNLHISPKDAFIKERLGDKVPEEWQLDLFLEEGNVSESYVRISDAEEWKDFDVEDSSVDSIQALFFKGEKASFTIKVELKDEKFAAYKEKYGKERAKYGWMHEKPLLPEKWIAEKGSSSHGSTHIEWEWSCSGPKDSEKAAKDAVESFLEGFTFSFK